MLSEHFSMIDLMIIQKRKEEGEERVRKRHRGPCKSCVSSAASSISWVFLPSGDDARRFGRVM